MITAKESLNCSVGILPVICIHNQAELNTLLLSLDNTPVHCIEITLRHEFALEAIKIIKKAMPHMTVGAGTVVSPTLLTQAIEAGADFCVSPGTDYDLLHLSQAQNISFIPGCSTPTEIQNVQKMGYSLVKYFPAECSGGIRALTLYEGAFPNITFVPTGGITLENISDYLNRPNVLACGGSFMIPKDKLAAGDHHTIRDLILQCCSIRGGNTTL